MRANLSNWGIEHVTNKLWIEELTVDEYIRVYGGFYELRSKVVSDSIVRDRVDKEVASSMKYMSMELCERQITKYDKFITRVIFNVFAAIVKETDHEHKRRRI